MDQGGYRWLPGQERRSVDHRSASQKVLLGYRDRDTATSSARKGSSTHMLGSGSMLADRFKIPRNVVRLTSIAACCRFGKVARLLSRGSAASLPTAHSRHESRRRRRCESTATARPRRNNLDALFLLLYCTLASICSFLHKRKRFEFILILLYLIENVTEKSDSLIKKMYNLTHFHVPYYNRFIPNNGWTRTKKKSTVTCNTGSSDT